MSRNISCAKINIICFQGDEGPIGPPGPSGLEVRYYINTWYFLTTGKDGEKEDKRDHRLLYNRNVCSNCMKCKTMKAFIM